MTELSRRISITAVACAALSALAACSGPGSAVPAAGSNQKLLGGAVIRSGDAPSPLSAAAPRSLPLEQSQSPALGLPSPAELLSSNGRATRFTLNDGLRTGSQFDSLLPSNRVAPSGSAATFQPNFSSNHSGLERLAYAIYNFTLPDYGGRYVEVSLDWAAPPAAGLGYIGLGNFDSGRWEWYSAVSGEALHFEDFGPRISASDKCLLVVAVRGTALCSLNQVSIYTPQPPEAILQSDTQDGLAPLTVFFDASGSVDSDGTISDYEWDFDGNGIYGEPGDEASAAGQSSFSRLFEQPGSYQVWLEVTDDDGLTDTDSLVINANSSPNTSPLAQLEADPLMGQAPLQVSFDASSSSDPDGSITDFEWDFDGDGIFNEPDNGELAAQGNAQPALVTYLDPGDYNPVLRVTDDDGAKSTATVLIKVSAAGAVTAVLESDISEGDAPVSVSFDGSNSLGPITDYEWDFDGDGVFNEAGAEATAQGSATPAAYLYSTPGIYMVSLRVSDALANQDTDSLSITAHGWAVIELAESGVYPSIAVINGHPAICYHNWTPLGTCRYQYASTEFGTEAADWSAPVSVETTVAASGWQSSMFEASGAPAIAYFSTGTTQVYYERATSATGAAAADWSTASIPIGSGGISYYGFDAEMVNGSPAIVWYREGGGSELRYARASNSTGASGTDWSGGTLLSIVSSGATGMGKHASLATISGTPAVAFLDFTSGAVLKYAHSSTPGGGSQADWLITTVAATGAESCSLTEIDGAPAIAYAVQNSGAFYRRSASASGDQQADWDMGSLVNLQIASPFGSGLDMDIVNGHPAVMVHRISSPYELRYAEAASADGALAGDWSSGVNETADSGASSLGEWMEMAVLPGGQPCFACRGWTEQIDENTYVDRPVRYGVMF